MSGLVYLVTEGAHDVAFLGKLLTVCHGASRVRTTEKLDALCQDWVGSLKWPMPKTREPEIVTLSVPVPVFYGLPGGGLVALREAGGISNIVKTLKPDLEFFRRNQGPEAIALIVDSDDEPKEVFGNLAAMLRAVKLTAPPALGEVTAGPPRVGVFALPSPGDAGSLEDLLLTLSEVAYPELTQAARGYANDWRTKAAALPAHPDWHDIKKPAGTKKATLAAMTAILKPGKSTEKSLEDNRWVSHETKALPALQPCLAFLKALLATTAPAPVAAPES